MDKFSTHADVLLPKTAASIHSLIDAAREWLDSFFCLVVLEGKSAGIGLVLMHGFGVCAIALLLVGWIALVTVGLVENGILDWRWALLLVALLNFTGAVGLLFLAIKRSRQLRFIATRRDLNLKATATPVHE
jgi:uncharacterized membrane protein YqjE